MFGMGTTIMFVAGNTVIMETKDAKSTYSERIAERFSENKLQLLLVTPVVIWFTFFLIIPLFVIGYYSFFSVENFQIIREFTLGTWQNEVFTSANAEVFARTFGFAFGVTAVSILLGYPVAYYIRFHLEPRIGFLVVLLSIIPFLISGIIRALAWRPVLGQSGVINEVLTGLGVINQPLEWLLFSPFAMFVGYLANFIVFMYVPIYAALLNVDTDLIDASRTLRATPWNSFKTVVLPLSLPGVAIGSIFVFVLTLGDFVTPQFFSSGEATIPGAIFLQVNLGLNWPTASGLSLLLIALILTAIAVLFRFIDITDSFS